MATCSGNEDVLNSAVVNRSAPSDGVDFCVATTHLHGGALHPRHTGNAVEDGERDGNGDEETAHEGPQVAPACPRLLSHHLDR